MKDDIIIKMFDKNELRRIERCVKTKNKEAIIEWGQNFEARLSENYNKIFKEKYAKELRERLIDLDIAVMYALHFNENTRFGNKRLKDFMDDLAATMQGFYKDDFNRAEYRRMLIEDGIKIDKED